jgi:hypothetical protein
MTRNDVKQAAIKHYKERYPEMLEVTATEVIMDSLDGHLAVIRARAPSGEKESEITLVYPDGHVTLFTDTEELARHIDRVSRIALIDRISNRSNVAGLVLIVSLIGVFAVGHTTYFRPDALAIIGSLVGAAAGYFFATGRAA